MGNGFIVGSVMAKANQAVAPFPESLPLVRPIRVFACDVVHTGFQEFMPVSRTCQAQYLLDMFLLLCGQCEAANPGFEVHLSMTVPQFMPHHSGVQAFWFSHLFPGCGSAPASLWQLTANCVPHLMLHPNASFLTV